MASKNGRKTIEIEALKERVNNLLKLKSLSADERKGLCHLLEWALFETTNYRGFNWVHWSNEGGYESWRDSGLEDTLENSAAKAPFIYGNAEGVDDYRRFYY